MSEGKWELLSVTRRGSMIKSWMNTLKPVAAAWLVLGISGFSIPGYAAWQQLGPYGGSAESIVIAPNDSSLLVAATRNGLIYRSQDAGEHWSPVRFAQSLALSGRVMKVSSESTPAYYLGGVPGLPEETGLYKSTDGGATWQPVPGLAGKAVYSLATYAKEPNVVAAGAHDGVYMSIDSGNTWKRISPVENAEMQLVTSLAINPDNRQVIYAGTAHLPWKTENGGETWSSIHTGMIDDSDVFSIEIDAAHPDHILASACSGIYLSNSAGGQWSKMLGVPRTSRRTYTIRRDPARQGVIYAGTSQGLWKSTDEGATWTQISPMIAKSLAFESKGGRLYLATEDRGLAVSEDGGKTFRQINEGFVNRNLKSLIESKAGYYTASPYDGNGTNLYRMSFNGQWTAIKPPAARRPSNLLSVVWVNTNTLFGLNNGGLLRSADGGKVWTVVNGIRGRARAVQVVGPKSLLLGTSEGLFRSDDLGVKWIAVKPGTSIESIHAGHGVIVVNSGEVLLVSSDLGKTWASVQSPAKTGEIYQLAIGANGILLAATSNGGFRSSDGGHTWQLASNGVTVGTVRAVAFDAAGATAFAIQHGVVYRSQDAGITWTAFDMTGIEGATIVSLVVPEAEPGKIFAATQARGVFVSPISGADAGRLVASQTTVDVAAGVAPKENRTTNKDPYPNN
jgi:photosystem II stability/assembly factor-like uncharacterized protein